jgi:hypothetical protein
MPHFNDKDFKLGHYLRGLMKTRLRWSFTITICTLLMVNIALPQETLKQDSSATVTIVTAGDISVTRAADGKTAVSINFVPGKAKSDDTRITISGPYSLDVNGGVKEVKSPQGVELHVLSHEELRFEAPEIGLWEQSHKFSQNSACMKIPKYPGCGNPVCDQSGHPGDQCRYNSGSGCSCVAAGGGPCSETANPAQRRKLDQTEFTKDLNVGYPAAFRKGLSGRACRSLIPSR